MLTEGVELFDFAVVCAAFRYHVQYLTRNNKRHLLSLDSKFAFVVAEYRAKIDVEELLKKLIIARLKIKLKIVNNVVK